MCYQRVFKRVEACDLSKSTCNCRDNACKSHATNDCFFRVEDEIVSFREALEALHENTQVDQLGKKYLIELEDKYKTEGNGQIDDHAGVQLILHFKDKFPALS